MFIVKWSHSWSPQLSTWPFPSPFTPHQHVTSHACWCELRADPIPSPLLLLYLLLLKCFFFVFLFFYIKWQYFSYKFKEKTEGKLSEVSGSNVEIKTVMWNIGKKNVTMKGTRKWRRLIGLFPVDWFVGVREAIPHLTSTRYKLIHYSLQCVVNLQPEKIVLWYMSRKHISQFTVNIHKGHFTWDIFGSLLQKECRETFMNIGN